MLRTNKDRLVKLSVQGGISPPGEDQDYLVGPAGPRVVPGWGGICYNVRVGQRCMGLAGDHTEPGVTLCCGGEDAAKTGFSTYACIGNEAVVVTGGMRGETGFVTGKHDRDRVMVHFGSYILDRLCHDDKVLIKACGQGLALLDFPEITVLNLDPELFAAMGVVQRSGKLVIPVAHRVPAELMGSGTGGASAYRGDVDIMTQDRRVVRALGLHTLRFGDVVLLEDCDCTCGRGYRKGAVTIGVVVHGDSVLSGHGPGVTPVLTCRTGLIEGVRFADANIALYHPMTRYGFLRAPEQSE